MTERFEQGKLAGRWETWKVADLIPYERNSKKHPPEQIEKIAQSIQKHGFDQGITIDRNGVIIKGHGRRLALIKLGWESVQVLVRDDLTAEEVRASRIADNKVAESEHDQALLTEEILDLADSYPDVLVDLGFDDDELTTMLSVDTEINLDPETNEEDAPAAPTPRPESLKDKSDEFQAAYQLIVTCSDVDQQETLYNELSERGLSCRVLSVDVD